MATTGTTDFNLNVTDLIEEAWERATGGDEIRSGYQLRTARRSLNLLLNEWANRGLNLWTIEQGDLPLQAGVAAYDLPEDTVDLLEHVTRTTSSGGTTTDLPLNRISVSTYSSIPNKTSQGRPLQIYLNRHIVPQATVWPVPSSDDYILVYWRMRRIQDAGNGANTQEVPFRFLPCLVAGLAFFIAQKVPEGVPRLQMLKQEYEESWLLASTEDRERATWRLVPRGR